MANANSVRNFAAWVILLVITANTLSNGLALLRLLVSYRGTDLVKPKGAVKTIESREDREVIDCVDIFRQPAFNHPLLKNHTIQMKPSFHLKGNGAEHFGGALRQAWRKYGECPEGTIPIRRPQKYDSHRDIPFAPQVKRLARSQYEFRAPPGHEYAAVSMTNGSSFGAHASISVWNPTVEDLEHSFSQIWLSSGHEDIANTIEAGWIVDTGSSFGRRTRAFIYWTTDDYQDTGCYNLECPGFMQVDRKVALGSPIQPISTYSGQQHDIYISVTKDQDSGNWWLRMANVDLGYWPGEIFTSLAGGATEILWGGEIINTELDGHHTATQMGSGHFPSEGFGKASFFRNLKFVDASFNKRDAENVVKCVTRPECYDLQIDEDKSGLYGVHFHYGGPGFSSQCPK